jgi:hypothetical protein
MITGNSMKFSGNKNFELVSHKFDSAAEKCGATNNRIWLAYKFGFFFRAEQY